MTMKFDEAQVQRTMSGIVRAEITNIELWQSRGARLLDIYNQFLAQGLVGSFDGFKKAVQRARSQIDLPAGAMKNLTVSTEPAAALNVQSSAQLEPQKASVQLPSQLLASPHKPAPASDERVDVGQFFRRKSIFDR